MQSIIAVTLKYYEESKQAHLDHNFEVTNNLITSPS